MGKRLEWRYTLTIEEPDGFTTTDGTDLAQAIADAVQDACRRAGVRFEGLGWVIGGAR
jgi:hypothetical protein